MTTFNSDFQNVTWMFFSQFEFYVYFSKQLTHLPYLSQWLFQTFLIIHKTKTHQLIYIAATRIWFVWLQTLLMGYRTVKWSNEYWRIEDLNNKFRKFCEGTDLMMLYKLRQFMSKWKNWELLCTKVMPCQLNERK